jgi:hypothetical protein
MSGLRSAFFRYSTAHLLSKRSGDHSLIGSHHITYLYQFLIEKAASVTADFLTNKLWTPLYVHELGAGMAAPWPDSWRSATVHNSRKAELSAGR